MIKKEKNNQIIIEFKKENEEKEVELAKIYRDCFIEDIRLKIEPLLSTKLVKIKEMDYNQIENDCYIKIEEGCSFIKEFVFDIIFPEDKRLRKLYDLDVNLYYIKEKEFSYNNLKFDKKLRVVFFCKNKIEIFKKLKKLIEEENSLQLERKIEIINQIDKNLKEIENFKRIKTIEKYIEKVIEENKDFIEECISEKIIKITEETIKNVKEFEKIKNIEKIEKEIKIFINKKIKEYLKYLEKLIEIKYEIYPKYQKENEIKKKEENFNILNKSEMIKPYIVKISSNHDKIKIKNIKYKIGDKIKALNIEIDEFPLLYPLILDSQKKEIEVKLPKRLLNLYLKTIYTPNIKREKIPLKFKFYSERQGKIKVSLLSFKFKYYYSFLKKDDIITKTFKIKFNEKKTEEIFEFYIPKYLNNDKIEIIPQKRKIDILLIKVKYKENVEENEKYKKDIIIIESNNKEIPIEFFAKEEDYKKFKRNKSFLKKNIKINNNKFKLKKAEEVEEVKFLIKNPSLNINMKFK